MSHWGICHAVHSHNLLHNLVSLRKCSSTFIAAHADVRIGQCSRILLSVGRQNWNKFLKPSTLRMRLPGRYIEAVFCNNQFHFLYFSTSSVGSNVTISPLLLDWPLVWQFRRMDNETNCYKVWPMASNNVLCIEMVFVSCKYLVEVHTM